MNPGKDYPFQHLFDRKRYSERMMMLRPSEDDVQAAILSALAAMGIPAMAVDAGAKKLRGRAYGALKRGGLSTAILKGQTGAGMAGMVDIIGCIPKSGRALFIEVKAPAWLDGNGKVARSAGKPTDQQLEFLATMHRAGAVVGVAWALDDLKAILAS